MEWWRLLVLLNYVSGAISVHVKLYKGSDFTDLLWQGSLTTTCYNVPGFDPRFSSIITDTCVIVYSRRNCEISHSRKIMTVKRNDFFVQKGSMHLCTDEEGGPQLNIDITTFNGALLPEEFKFFLHSILSNPFSDIPSKHPNILERYDDVCDCRNVPQYVQNVSMWSIDNHHNQLFAYFEPNCKQEHSKALFIRAGHSDWSWSIWENEDNSGGINRKIQSFGPDPNTPYFQHCLDIMRLEHYELSKTTSQPRVSVEDFRKNTKASHPRVQFFEETNLEDFLFESQSTDLCTTLPKPTETKFFVTDKILSIKTDTCVMVYSKEECKGRSFKLQPPGSNNLTKEWEGTVTGPITLGSIYTPVFDWKWLTKSFSFCKEPESHLNVDVTEYQSDLEEGTLEVLKQYRDICTCQNIPKHVRRMDKWSINNFGRSMLAYFEDKCQSEVSNPLWIPAGRSSFSMGLGSFKHQKSSANGIIQKVRSIGPDPAASYFKNRCVKLFSTIIKFEIDEPTSSNSVERNITTTFENDSKAVLEREYSASQTVRQSVQVDVGKSFSEMNSVHVDESVDFETRRHVGSSESKSTGSTTGWSQFESSSTSETQGSEKRESQSNSKHESTDRRHTGNVGGTLSTVLKAIGIDVSGGYEYSSTNTKGSSSGSESSKSDSASRTSGRDKSSGQSGGTSVGRENSANYFKEDGFKQSLGKAYERSGTLSSSGSKSSTREKTTSKTSKLKVTVPPCTELNVSHSVEVVTKRVEYRVIAKITGQIGDQEMTSNEVRQYMSRELEYIGDFDEHTVMAYTTGNLTAKFVLKSVFKSKGSIYKNCPQRHELCPV